MFHRFEIFELLAVSFFMHDEFKNGWNRDVTDKCALCGDRTILLESHILPAFVFRWLKKTSGGGYLRNINLPNKRVQDGLKYPLLCASCEKLINTFETPFATEIFYPFTNDDIQEVHYQQWMARFCTSVSWRVLTYYQTVANFDHLTPRQRVKMNEALIVWKDFLLGKVNNVGVYEQHLLPLSAIVDGPISKLPTNINRYFLRAIDMDLPASKTLAFTFAKLGRFVVIGMISRPRRKWIGTKIYMKHGAFRPRKYVLQYSIIEYLMYRANMIEKAVRNISGKQNQIIEDEMNRNLERFRNSKQFEAIIEDGRLFGLDAILRKD